jgi:uncharacterized protein YgiM (DUF1202 family)
MASRKTYTVDWAGGVCVREKASKDAKILAVLPQGEKVTVDSKTDAPDGWTAVSGGGYTMTQYLK